MNSPSAGSGGPPRGPQFDNRRVAAGLIDLVVVLAIFFVVGFVVGLVAGSDREPDAALGVLALAWGLFYYFATESGNGQTLGKRIMGLRVLAVDGRPADAGAVAVRTVLRLIDGIGLYLVGLVAMIASGQRRQRLGDLVGKTIVTSADWRPATGAPAATAPTPTGAAIVLPTAAPELPAGATQPHAASEPASTAGSEQPVVAEDAPGASPEPVVTADASAEPASTAVPEQPAVAEDAPVPEVELASAPPVWSPAPADPEPASAAAPIVDAIVDGPADGTWEPVAEGPAANGSPSPPINGSAPAQPRSADDAVESAADEPVRLRSVETMSAIDQLMSELDEDEPAGHRPAS